MDKPVMISMAVMGVVAVIEILCLFCCSKLRMKQSPIAAVVPIERGDTELEVRLEYFLRIFERGSADFDRLLLLDCGGTEKQLRFCREFCKSCPCAEIVEMKDFEKKLSEIFAIPIKT